jgi:hypothetical protein
VSADFNCVLLFLVFVAVVCSFYSFELNRGIH